MEKEATMTPIRTSLAWTVATLLGTIVLSGHPAHAQTSFYGGISVGGYAPRTISTPVYGGYGAYGGGYQAYPSGYGQAYAPVPRYSPAQRQGYIEGRRYYETGIAPSHPLSRAEARGFVSGEARQARQPWQVDPARQQGYREGQYYWETGLRPNRPLSPAERQGFLNGERQAAGGYYRSW